MEYKPSVRNDSLAQSSVRNNSSVPVGNAFGQSARRQVEPPPESTMEQAKLHNTSGSSTKKDQMEKFLKTHWDVTRMVSEVEDEQRQLTAYYKRSCDLREEQNKQAMMLLDEIVSSLDAHRDTKKQKEHIAEDIQSHKHKKQEDRQGAVEKIKDREDKKDKVLNSLDECLQRLRPPLWKKDPPPKYTSYPEVEVAVKVFYISNVDTADMKFEIDMLLMIDWVDENFRDISDHELPHLDWSETYFNPCVVLENAVSGDQEYAEGRDEHPRLDKVDNKNNGKPKPDEKDRIWLKKTQRWRGYMAMEDVDLSCFPFDMQVLPIVIRTSPLRLTAGRVRFPRLVHPTKRLSDEQYSKTAKQADTVAQQKYAMKHTGGGQFIGPLVDEQLTEFKLKGVRGVTDAECSKNTLTAKRCNGEMFQVQIFVERPWLSSYTWNLFIMTTLVLLSATSFWDTASPDLSSRLSISLTIILTLAAYTSNRAAPIEKTPSLTFQDEYELLCLILVIIVSLMNIVSVVMCGGDNENAPAFMQEEFESNAELCDMGICSSRKIDCEFCFVFLVITGCTLSYRIRQVHHRRQESTQEIREMTNVLVAEEKKQHWSSISKQIANISRLGAKLAGKHTDNEGGGTS